MIFLHVACCGSTRKEGKPLVATVTEQPDNPGTLVTKAAPIIAAQVWQMMERPPAGMTFIEYYLKDGEESYAEERFALVTFSGERRTFSNPQWRHLSTEAAERIIGQSL